MNFEKVNTDYVAAPQETIKSIAGDICRTACEIDCVLRAMEAQVFDTHVPEPERVRGDTLEETLILAIGLMNSTNARLHDFANRMGVEV